MTEERAAVSTSARAWSANPDADVTIKMGVLLNAGMITFCRERNGPTGEWCGNPAEFVIWGKLFPAESLGPRCYDCAAGHIGHRTLVDRQAAIIDLRPLLRIAGGYGDADAKVEFE